MRQWIVTPYFFDDYDPELQRAVPPDCQFQINDPGNVEDREPKTLGRVHRPVADFVENAVREGHVPVSIAGDCVCSLPVMAGLQRNDLKPILVWLDAHPDFSTYETSQSGFLGGMPLAMMVGHCPSEIPLESGHQPILEADSWLIDGRKSQPLASRDLKNSSVNCAQISDLPNLQFDRPVHLHLDNDVIDPSETPANNYIADGGPSLQETINACVAFISNNQICAVSLSGWNSTMDHDGKTATACAKLMKAVTDAVKEKLSADQN